MLKNKYRVTKPFEVHYWSYVLRIIHSRGLSMAHLSYECFVNKEVINLMSKLKMEHSESCFLFCNKVQFDKRWSTLNSTYSYTSIFFQFDKIPTLFVKIKMYRDIYTLCISIQIPVQMLKCGSEPPQEVDQFIYNGSRVFKDIELSAVWKRVCQWVNMSTQVEECYISTYQFICLIYA